MMRRFRQFPQIGGKRGGLLYDAEVEYLESVPVGNETTMPVTYIDTGIKSTTPMTVTVDCEFVTLKRNSLVFGSRSSADGRIQFGTGGNTAGTLANLMNVGYGTANNISFLPTDGFHEYVVEFGNPTRVLYDGEIKLSTTKSLFSNDLTMWMFASNAFNGVYGAASKIRISSFKVEQGGSVVFDAVPVRKNGVGYMYDRVSGKLLANQGTGEYVVGPDKKKTIPWIKFDGASAIMLGALDTRMTVEVVAKYNRSGTLVGTYTNSRYWSIGSYSNYLAATVVASGRRALLSAQYADYTKRRYKVNWQDGFSVDGEDYVPFSSSTTDWGYVYLCVGARGRSATTVDSYSTSTVYSVKIWRDDSGLIFDLTPVDLGNGVGGLYDSISGRTFTNIGTGTIQYGEDEA